MRKSRVEEQSGTCEWCPHGLVLLRSGTYWCPCEDCHAGGRIQGRTYPDTVTQVKAREFTPVAPTAKPVPATKDAEVWVDPVHRV